MIKQVDTDYLKLRFQDIVRQKSAVVLFGIGLIGKQVFHALRELHVPVQAILDNNVEKWGTDYERTPIMNPIDCSGRNIPVVIGVKGDYRPILRQLTDLGFVDVIPYSFPLIWEHDSPSEQMLHKLDLLHFSNAIRKQESEEAPLLALHSVDVVITEKCSLRCKACSNLMQYFSSPQHANFVETVQSLDVLLNSNIFVDEIRLLGGEPFINPEWDSYVKYILSHHEDGAIVLYTNGTIIPSNTQLQVLKHKRVFVVISNYENVSRKAHELAKTLWAYGVNAHLQQVNEWQDCASLKHYGRTIEENSKIFQTCCVRNMLTIKDNKLFRCPFAANAAALRGLPFESNQCVNLMNPITSDRLIQDIEDLMSIKVLNACDYCGGRSNNEYTIPAAIQVPHPLPYTRFDWGVI